MPKSSKFGTTNHDRRHPLLPRINQRAWASGFFDLMFGQFVQSIELIAHSDAIIKIIHLTLERKRGTGPNKDRNRINK